MDEPTPPAGLSDLPPTSHCFCREIEQRQDEYEIHLGGSLDEFNTADYPETYVKHHRLESAFQANRDVVIENIGDCDVVDFRLSVNGRRRWHDAEDILGSILAPGMDEPAIAMAIFRFCFNHFGGWRRMRTLNS